MLGSKSILGDIVECVFDCQLCFLIILKSSSFGPGVNLQVLLCCVSLMETMPAQIDHYSVESKIIGTYGIQTQDLIAAVHCS